MADIISARSPVRLLAFSSVSLPKMATASGARSSSPAAYRLDASTWAIRSAALVSSRSSRRYQGDDPSSSLTCRNASKPASGSAASANQPSRTGSSVRWIAARRDTPEVSASMWCSAPAGST